MAANLDGEVEDMWQQLNHYYMALFPANGNIPNIPDEYRFIFVKLFEQEWYEQYENVLKDKLVLIIQNGLFRYLDIQEMDDYDSFAEDLDNLIQVGVLPLVEFNAADFNFGYPH